MIPRKISVIGILLVIFSLTMITVSAEPAASRDLPEVCIQPGSQFTVQISASNYGSAGQVTETLCTGWNYVSSSLDTEQVVVSGNVVTFYLLGETSFTYTVQAPSTLDASCGISGTIKDFDQNVESVGGESQVSVCSDQNGPSASRDLPEVCIQPGGQFTVQISASNYGSAGQVTETLCTGWNYVSSSLDTEQVVVSGNVVTFYLLGETSFTYTVQAPSTSGASCSISGTIKDFDQNVGSVGGESQVSVCSDQGTGPASRDLPDCVLLDSQFTVQISASNYGSAGQVTETLCDGWNYVSSSLDTEQVVVSGNVVTFYLLGETSFTYTVQAPSTPSECCDISGTITDFDQNVETIGGESQVCVCDEDSPRPKITDPADDATVSGIITIVEEDLSGQDDIVYNLFEYRPVSGTTWTEIGNDTNGSDGWWVLWNTKAVANGSYYIRATMGDNESLTGSDQISVTVDNPPQYGISLESGWNFISVPYELDNSSVDYVLADINYSVLAYYNALNKVCDDVLDLEPLKGYWICNPEEGTQVILGELLVPKATPPVPATLTVYEGWNAIGYTDSVDILPAEVALSSIDESYETIKGPFDPVTGSYEQVGWNGQTGIISGKHVGTDVFEMGSYEAFWVFVTQKDMLSAV